MNDPDFDNLQKRARELPRELTPSRDLWPEIARQLDQPASAHPAPRFRLRPAMVLLAAASLGVLLTGLWLLKPRVQPTRWSVAANSGTPFLDARKIESNGSWRSGQWLETDAHSSARLTIGEIGEVTVDPNSRLKLVDTSPGNHRLQLERGALHALIWAPPRLFFVETPSATAIDLGCAYTLTVDEKGVGTLEVTSGYVALDHQGRQSIIPAGMRCITRPGSGPGTPYVTSTTAEFRDALDRFDTGITHNVATLLVQAQSSDAISLWHLLARTQGEDRRLVFEKLSIFQPLPSEVTSEGILSLNRDMLNRWAAELGLNPSILL